MSTASKAVAVVVALAVMGLLAAFMLPVAINELEGDTNESINQTTASTVDVNGELNSTLDSTTADTEATYTLESDGESETNTIAVGSNATYSFDRGDVVVTVEESESGYATAAYEYERDYAYSGGASGLWGLLGMVMVLAVVLVVIREAMDMM